MLLALSLLNLTDRTYRRSDQAACARPHAPGDAFNPVILLMGLSTGVLPTLSAKLPFSAALAPNAGPACRRDLDAATALRENCPWFFHEVAARVDVDRAQLFVKDWDFGNATVEGTFEPPYWHAGGVLASADQFAAFLGRLYESELPVEAAHANGVLDLMLWDNTPTRTTRGWSGAVRHTDDTPETDRLGWHIGVVRSGETRHAFAAVYTGSEAASPANRADCLRRVIELTA